MIRTAYLKVLALGATIALGACAEVQFLSHAAKEASQTEVVAPASATRDVENGSHYKVGKPYQIIGIWYYPAVDYAYSEEGIASWYGPGFDGKETANGAIFDMNKVSAAHKTLPLPSIVRVTNLENGRSLKIKVNDRGPYAQNRIIDLSRRAAQLLGFQIQGTALVRVEIVEDESRQLAAFMRGEGREEPGLSPPKPEAAPTVAVSGTELAPPPGTVSSPPPEPEFQVSATNTPDASVQAVSVTELPESDTSVTIDPVRTQPQAFVQAGAFSQYVNAQRAQALLSGVGNVSVEQIMSSSVPLFRIRLGPAANAAEADELLARVIEAGYTEARIVIVN